MNAGALPAVTVDDRARIARAVALLGQVVATAWASVWLVLILLMAGGDDPLTADELLRSSVGVGLMAAVVVLPWCLRRTAITYLAALGLAAIAGMPALFPHGTAFPAVIWSFIVITLPCWTAAAVLLAAYALERDAARVA